MKLTSRYRKLAGAFALVVCMALIAVLVVFVVRPSETASRQAASSVTEQGPKRLVVFLDGTWNTVNTNTNVWRMRALCAPVGADGKPQLAYYSIGVNGFLGGAFGQGIDENILLSYEWLVENYNAGDEIFVFGFSRGAYAARSLAGLVAIDGVLKPGSPIGIGELFDRHKQRQTTIWRLEEMEAAGDTSTFTTQEKWLLKYSQPVQVRFVGVWDTVGSLGWKKGNIPGVSRSSFDYLQTGLRIHILNAYQALAIDEHRDDFAPTLWTKRLPKNASAVVAEPRPISSVEQRWFVGAHANVGGGYQTDLLAQPPLRWMMKKAEVHGLSFRSEVELDGNHLTAPIADSYGEFAGGMYSWLSSRLYRSIGRDADIRDDGSHISVNETIDASVFDRWRVDPTYRPKNLVEWADRKSVDPAQLRSSVMANDPRVVLSDQLVFARVDAESPVDGAESGEPK